MNVRTVKYTEENAPSVFTQSLHQTGFSVLKNHPIDLSLINDVYEEWSMFFSREIKNNYLFNENTQDGFFPFKSENAKGNSAKDLKEFFHFYPWGMFPKGLSNKTKILFKQLLELAETLLEWIERESPENVKLLFSMPLPEMVDSSPNNLLRIIHYPSLKGDEDKNAAFQENLHCIAAKEGNGKEKGEERNEREERCQLQQGSKGVTFHFRVFKRRGISQKKRKKRMRVLFLSFCFHSNIFP